jgi:hypothetical protein
VVAPGEFGAGAVVVQALSARPPEMAIVAVSNALDRREAGAWERRECTRKNIGMDGLLFLGSGRACRAATSMKENAGRRAASGDQTPSLTNHR